MSFECLIDWVINGVLGGCGIVFFFNALRYGAMCFVLTQC